MACRLSAKSATQAAGGAAVGGKSRSASAWIAGMKLESLPSRTCFKRRSGEACGLGSARDGRGGRGGPFLERHRVTIVRADKGKKRSDGRKGSAADAVWPGAAVVGRGGERGRVGGRQRSVRGSRAGVDAARGDCGLSQWWAGECATVSGANNGREGQPQLQINYP